MKVVHALLLVLALASHARADNGFIGKTSAVLEIEDCRQVDPALTQQQLVQRATESYLRGETLYLQGDYDGAVSEFVTAYCTLPTYRILKDIGQAYERSLDYEKAIAYLEKYVHDMPADAKKANACAAEPQEDKSNVERRITVLKQLQGHVYVETSPSGAHITIEAITGNAKASSSSGKAFDLVGGIYEMTVERDGFEPYSQKIEVKIGKPYTYFVALVPQRGQLAVLVTPADARIFLGDRQVEFGHEELLTAGSYQLSVESPGYVTTTKTIEVLPNRINRELVELEPVPQTGRRQLIIAAGLGGATATGALLYAFKNTSIVGVGGVLGGAAGLVGSYFQLPRDLSLATSNLTITTGLAGAIGGGYLAAVFTGRQEIIQPVAGATAIVGAGLGYYAGEKLHVRVGDAALFNSSVLWGTAAGGLFALSFDPPRSVGAGLVLSGMGLGGISGVLLTRYFTIERTHALLIDIGGLVGMAGGLAIESLAYPQKTTSQSEAGRNTEHLANFALGGMVIGLLGASVLTRNLDVPTIPLRPTFQTTTGTDGKQTSLYGLGGTW